MLSTYELLGILFGSLSPCAPLLFYGINFYIGEGWMITQQNFIGIFLAVLSFIFLVISYFHLHNLTQDETFQYLKHEIHHNNEEKTDEKATGKPSQALWNTKDILARGNLMFLLLTEAFLSYNYFQMELVIVMTAVKTYHLTVMHLGLLTGGVVVLVAVLLYNVQKRLLRDGLNIFFLYVTCFIIIALYESFLLLILNLHLTSFYSQDLAIFVLIACNSIQGFGSTVYCRWLMFSSTPSHSASIVESHRYIFCRLMASIGFFTSSYVFEALWFAIPLYVSICFIIVILYAIKRKDYMKM